MIYVAGRVVDDPVERLADYAGKHPETVRQYDAPGPGDPNLLTLDEVIRTRIIKSRISRKEAEWFVERGHTAPWSEVDSELRLADLDPEVTPQAYEAADRLYRHFREPRRAGVAMAKVSKVLHLKRPHLVPILDGRLERRYRAAAREQALAHLQLQPLARRRYWLAVRQDLLQPGLQDALAEARAQLRERGDITALLADASEVRLLDILAWG